jgi:uncharacterized protein HemX
VGFKTKALVALASLLVIGFCRNSVDDGIQRCWEVVLICAITAGSVYSAQQQQAQKKAQDKAQKLQAAALDAAKKQYELQAGDYAEQTKQEMAINAYTQQTQSLVDILNQQKPEPKVFTLPTAESTNPIDRINNAIDAWIKGN